MIRFLGSVSLVIAFAVPVAAATPAAELARWGPWPVLPEKIWWRGNGDTTERYSWLVPGQTMLVERFWSDGSLQSKSTLRVEDHFLIIDGNKLPFVPKDSMSAKVGASTFELQPDRKSFIIRSPGKESERRDYFVSTAAPKFPDASLRARMAGKPACPATLAALDAYLSRIPSTDAKAETKTVGFFGGSAGKRSFSTASVQLLGVKPLSLQTAIIKGKPYGLTAMLPGYELSRYKAALRAAVPRGYMRCSENSCNWRPVTDTFKLPAGTLQAVDLSRVTFSNTDLALHCSYR